MMVPLKIVRVGFKSSLPFLKYLPQITAATKPPIREYKTIEIKLFQF